MSHEPQQRRDPGDPTAVGRPVPGASPEGVGEGRDGGTGREGPDVRADREGGQDGAEPPAADARRGRSRTRPRRTGLRRAVPTWRTVLGGCLLFALLLIGGFVTGYLLVGIPPANSAATAQSNVYLYKDGTQIARDGEVNRQSVRLSQVPLSVQRAVLAAEDRDFYSERAVDPQAMVRAAWNTVTGKGKQSGSTITQQYVKNYYLGQERTITRKVKEFFIAIKLDREESKADILEGYLNTSYFGRNAYGIQAAAHAYYGKDIGAVDTAEGAYLASLLNAPSAYDVAAHPENRPRVLARWNYTLDGMVTEKWLPLSDRATMIFPMPQTAGPATGLSGQRGYVVQAVEDWITGNGIVDEKTLARGGYRITTTLERKKQDAFVAAVDRHVMSRRDPGRAADRNVRVGGASIDPASGKVVAMYGGIDYTKQYVNNATRRDYQVGSTFKPFVLAAAVENGSMTQDGRRITPDTLYDGTDRRQVQGRHGPTGYAPENEDNVSYGPLSLRMATDHSVNSVYAQLAQDVGPRRVRDTAIALGVPETTPDLTATPSIALGVATASVLDMAEAYATLANHGRHGTYTLVERVTKDGVELDLPTAPARQAISREAADTTTSVLMGVVRQGSGTAALSSGRPAAGKTGTAEGDRAAWFAGYTPDLATVVAVMGQDPDTGAQKSLYGALGLPRINGGGAPAAIWGEFTAAALAGREAVDFDLTVAEGAEEEFFPFDEPGLPGDDPFGPVGNEDRTDDRRSATGTPPPADWPDTGDAADGVIPRDGGTPPAGGTTGGRPPTAGRGTGGPATGGPGGGIGQGGGGQGGAGRGTTGGGGDGGGPQGTGGTEGWGLFPDRP
ncbi:transglycosylase domain-containing protein [Streptomyces sp. WMMC940]|uniref:transglycosylase domain-containing protein n=1 Tax=Streptomyces sp. WMMC940 TaxID=3015153 RepID=UPI0022B65623|nr:transglycosylase domain-containing protein [Streptomyces sp. WMMC940]MCZ7460046.1 transglycosylase domain-containing protein [Streptomyces sp. WMMC940]